MFNQTLNNGLKPLFHYILLISYNIETSTNIYMPGTIQLYQVVEVGEDVTKIKTNNLVVVDTNKLINITWKQQQYYLIKEEDIYLIVEE